MKNCDNCIKVETIFCPLKGIFPAAPWAKAEVEADDCCSAWESAYDKAA